MEKMNMTNLDDIQLVAYLSVINYPKGDFRDQNQWMEKCYKWMKAKREEEQKNEKK